MKSKTAIIVINWNSALDTIECLDSIKNFIDVRSCIVFILDNGSKDSSVTSIAKHLKQHQFSYSRKTLDSLSCLTEDLFGKYILIESDVNHGFSGGNNLILRISYNLGCEYFWLLNNDTVFSQDCLTPMLKEFIQNDKLGFVGSVLLEHRNNLIQACGSRVMPLLGITKLCLKGKDFADIGLKPIKSDYQNGASLLLTRGVLETIGYLDENYFMYFEETDWQFRARSLGIENTLALGSIVVHKGSVSTKNKKHIFYYYFNRSSVLFFHRFFANTLIISILSLILVSAVRTRMNLTSFYYSLLGIFDGLFGKKRLF